MFQNLQTASLETLLTYTYDQYISVLSTYSPFLELDHLTSKTLFAELRQSMLEHGFGEIQLSYLSTYHVAQMMSKPIGRMDGLSVGSLTVD